MVDLTLSIFNIITTTTTVIVSLILTENYPTFTRDHVQQPQCDQGLKNHTWYKCSPEFQVEMTITKIMDKLNNCKVSEATILWKDLESKILIDNSNDQTPTNLMNGLSRIINFNQFSSFQSCLFPFIKNINLHIRLTGYSKIFDNLVTKQEENDEESENTDLIIFGNLLKIDWLSYKKILNKNEQVSMLYNMKKFPNQLKSLIFSKSVALWSSQENGYLYATGNKGLVHTPHQRPVFLWTPRVIGPTLIAPEGTWDLNYDQEKHFYVISNHYWKENLYSHCPNYSEETCQNVFTVKNELNDKFQCSSQWSIKFVNDEDLIVQIFMENIEPNEAIFSLNLDAKPMTNTPYNYRTQVFTKEHVNTTTANSNFNRTRNSWKIVPLTYIF